MTISELLEWLERSPPGILVRESIWGFPIVVAVHILALTLSVGTLVWFDLRLLGVALTGAPVSVVYRRLMPWTLTGFLIMFVSGGMLFSGFATQAYGNSFFWIKMSALVLAGLNAIVYHRVTEPGIARWDRAPRPPGQARIAGLVSMTLWAVIIVAGRMMSYTMF